MSGLRSSVLGLRWVPLLPLLLLLPLPSCGGEAAPESAPERTAPEAAIIVDTATSEVPVVVQAQLDVEHDASVFARTLGIVEAVHAELGDRVRAGALLAELEHADQEIALADAEAGHENARRTAERFRELAGTGAVSRADSEQAEMEEHRWALRVRQARRDLELTRVTAPFSGYVTRRRVRVGQLVEPLDTLFRVTALAPLKVSVLLPERAGTVAVGDTADVAAPGVGIVPAVVYRVSPTVDPASGTREVLLRAPAREGLRPGMAVEVRIGGVPRPVVALPPDLLLENRYVLVWEDGRATLRAVTVGAPLPDGRVEIVEGLSPGERVVRRQ